MRWQRELALREAREQQAYEDEQGTVGDTGDSGGRGRGQKLGIQCPQCGLKQKLNVPDGVSLDEVEDEEEAEGGMQTIEGQCHDCEAEFEVAPPEGYKFSFVPNSFRRSEGEDEEEVDSRRGSDAPLYRRRTGEAVRTFFQTYAGKSDRVDFAPDALTCFRESCKAAKGSARGPALPYL